MRAIHLTEQQRGGRGSNNGRWGPPPHNHHASVAPAQASTVSLHLQLAVTRINGEHTAAAPSDGPDLTPAQEGDAVRAYLVRLAQGAGDFPSAALADLEKWLLNDVWTGYVHMSCGAFVVPTSSSRDKTASGTIAALQAALNEGVARLVSPTNPSHLREPVNLVARSIKEIVNGNRHEKARGAFYVLNVEFEQPEQSEAITALLREAAKKTRLRLDLAGIAKNPHITIRKYGDQHALRRYSCRPGDVVTMLNPLLAAQPLKITSDVMQLVQPSNVGKQFVLCTKALAAPPLPADAAAGPPVAAGANPEFWQRPQPFWWAATSDCQRLSAALAANLRALDATGRLAAAAVPGGGGAVDPQSMDRSDSGSSVDSAVTAHQFVETR